MGTVRSIFSPCCRFLLSLGRGNLSLIRLYGIFCSTSEVFTFASCWRLQSCTGYVCLLLCSPSLSLSIVCNCPMYPWSLLDIVSCR